MAKIIDGECFPDIVFFIYDENGCCNPEECDFKNLKVEVSLNRNLKSGILNFKLNVTNFKLLEDEKDWQY